MKAHQKQILVFFAGILCLVTLTNSAFSAGPPPSLQWPVPSFTRNNSFLTHDYSEFGDVLETKHHTGLDIPAPGSQVVASHSGSVRVTLLDDVKEQKNNCLGNVVVITHKSDNATLYAHLAEVFVADDDYIKEEDVGRRVIGTVGGTAGRLNTGEFCDHKSKIGPIDGNIGVHLHFELKNHGKNGAADGLKAWGYVPAGDDGEPAPQFQPENYGYFDPVKYLHQIEEVEGEGSVTELGKTVNTRHGPGVRYGRTTSLSSLSSHEPLQVTGFVEGDPSICSKGWYQIQKSGLTYIKDTIDNLGLVPSTWVCAGNGNETWLATNITPVGSGGINVVMIAAALGISPSPPTKARVSLSVTPNPVPYANSPEICTDKDGQSRPWTTTTTLRETAGVGVTFNSYDEDYFDSNGQYINTQAEGIDFIQRAFNDCGPGTNRVPPKGRICAYFCTHLGSRLSGSSVRRLSGVDDKGNKVELQVRVQLEGPRSAQTLRLDSDQSGEASASTEPDLAPPK